jgi:hypothetical protein
MERQRGELSLSRRNACIPCTRAKRCCDKRLPSCLRCIEKESACQYPSSRPYARKAAIRGPQVPAVTDPADANHPDGQPCPCPAGSLQFAAVGPGDSNETNASSDVLSLSHDTDLSVDSFWFRRSESWAISHADAATTGVNITVCKQFIKGVKRWLREWVQNGHCPFIHRRLFFDTGFPPCLQDAFSTFTTYLSKTEHNEETVLQIVEDCANRLLRQQPLDDDSFMSVPSLRTSEHLARVLALFVYQMIRLFDGDIRARAQAELHISTLQTWTQQLWESADLDGSSVSLSTEGFLEGAAVPSDPAAKAWRAWILAESVRRTWMLVNYTQSIYLTLRDGHSNCSGGITFTARKGVWDATSAIAWARLIQSQDPLFVQGFNTHEFLSTTPAASLDVFGIFIMGIMWETDTIDAWLARSSSGNQFSRLVDIMKE